MSDKKKFSVKRRAALKKSLQGAVATGTITAAGSWKKPIVETVLLPAHAQTSQAMISIANLTILNGDCGPVPGSTLLNVNNPVNGSNVGTISRDTQDPCDNGTFSITGRVFPVPTAGTEVSLSVNETLPISDASAAPCVLEPGDSFCPTANLAVNNSNGDFSFTSEIGGLDDVNSSSPLNVYVVTLSVLGAPDTVVRINISND